MANGCDSNRFNALPAASLWPPATTPIEPSKRLRGPFITAPRTGVDATARLAGFTLAPRFDGLDNEWVSTGIGRFGVAAQ